MNVIVQPGSNTGMIILQPGSGNSVGVISHLVGLRQWKLLLNNLLPCGCRRRQSLGGEMNFYYLLSGLCLFFVLTAINKAFSFEEGWEGWINACIITSKFVGIIAILILGVYFIYLGDTRYG